MSGSRYRKLYIEIIEQGTEGHYPSHNNALTLRHGGQEQGACMPWVADAITLEMSQQPHSLHRVVSTAKRYSSMVWFRDVVSAEPLYVIAGRSFTIPYSDCKKIFISNPLKSLCLKKSSFT